MLQKIYISNNCCKCEQVPFSNNKWLFSTLLIIRMISEGSCDTEKTGVMAAEYSALQSQEINYI